MEAVLVIAAIIALSLLAGGLFAYLEKTAGPREVTLTQIAATTVLDQVGRQVTVVYALAASGSVWSLIDGEWRRIAPPTVGRQTH